ncbi:response regulator [Alicyclobacillus macrosporangiidus]|uniref:DNA-binding response regulator, NarL/FixJ family, contains REC and HTH domains n=1 Tax=Alicyclobacillus macrosporangiidus TaxID=392015 RepID=A0A1I7K6Z9_9BACL|nr:response regulator transcription factor [Alicyclobacillus macrosporangiidus]SFU93200.1 DNA-binding response regulator, NarL/FixJ family, contains REC and HTH domains [Alicyclobacillus macrosporangiidus]
MDRYKVLVADDNDRARRAVCTWLAREDRFHVVAEAANGMDAVRLTRLHHPDLVLMDLRMPGMDGWEATRCIKRDLPDITVVVLSVSDDPADLFEAVRAGAQGYLVKRMHPEDWIAYLLRVMDGDGPLPREMALRLWSSFRPAASDGHGAAGGGEERTPGRTGPFGGRLDSARADKLTAREQEVLRLVRTGATNREIADALFISENTVKNHIKNILAKLHLHNRVQLAAYRVPSGE